MASYLPFLRLSFDLDCDHQTSQHLATDLKERHN
jgi:hypothetical protein